MVPLKKLPIGIQNFREIIEKNYLYVDKNPHIHRMVTQGKLYFLARPRRFGKSVLVSTLDALFRGDKALFEGLFIANRWRFESHTVIRLDMLGIDAKSEETLARGLNQRLEEQAKAHGLRLREQDCTNRFRELILKLAERNSVAVLIDEYDKPILDHITEGDLAERYQKFLAGFFAVLKSVEDRLSFLFITGVSKFTKVSLFSDLNNLKDLTFHPAYAAICGYTEPELDRFFAPYLSGDIDGSRGDRLRARIKTWYDGYSWDGVTRVYNPVSVLNMLDEGRFEPFWFATGTPKFLIELLRAGKISIPKLENAEIHGYLFDDFNPRKINPLAIFFQTGYLTVGTAVKTPRGTIYRLIYPNREVKEAFLSSLLADFSGKEPGALDSLALRLGQDLKKGKIDTFCEGLRSLFAAIPYNIFLPDREAYYHTVVYLTLSLIGLPLACEIQTNTGRIDAVLETWNRFNVVEFKLGKAREALDQVYKTGYPSAYQNRGKSVFALGIGIDPKRRNIDDWIFEEVA